MHDIFLALVFVGLVTYPAIVAVLPTSNEKEPATHGFGGALAPAEEAASSAPTGLVNG
jgi:hypothetical protein